MPPVDKLTVEKNWPDNYRLQKCPVRNGCICDERVPPHSHSIDLVAMETLWKQAASMYLCICLQSRDDRLHEAANQFHRVGLCRLVQFFRPTRPDESYCQQHGIKARGFYGCWTSHSQCVDFARKHKATRLAVFEDDVLFRQDKMNYSHMKTVVHDIVHDLPADCDVMKLGQFTLSGTPVSSCQDSTNWYEPSRLFRSSSTTTHAMIWTTKGMQKMSENPFMAVRNQTGEESVDHWMRRNLIMYACFPQLALQSSSVTSNTNNMSPCLQSMLTSFLDFGIVFHRNFCDPWDLVAYYVLPILYVLFMVFATGGLLIGLAYLVGAVLNHCDIRNKDGPNATIANATIPIDTPNNRLGEGYI